MDILINIDVDDIDKAIAFYEDGLGLRLRRRLFGEDVAELVGASSIVYLLRKPAGTTAAQGSSATREYRRHWTPVHLDLVVDDVDASVMRATAAGAKLEVPAQSFAWGRIATLSDPFGHGFCLVHWIAGGYDEIA